MKKFFVLIIAILLSARLIAQEKQVIVPYTLADRDRAIRMEVRMETKFSSIDARFNSIDAQLKSLDARLSNRIDRLEDKFDSYFMWGFGLVLMSIFGLFGFIIYDRRTMVAPINDKIDRIIIVLRDSAERDAALKESLKRTSLL